MTGALPEPMATVPCWSPRTYAKRSEPMHPNQAWTPSP
jgi:hypothetical protein